MHTLLLVAISFMILLASMGGMKRSEIDQPKKVASAGSSIYRYQMFVYVSTLYMASYSGGAATVYWPTLRTASGAPSGAKNMDMPPTWKIVIAADRTWVACTEVDERSIGTIGQIASYGQKGVHQTTVSTVDYRVIGDAADLGKASVCT